MQNTTFKQFEEKRLEKGYTQRKVCELLDITPATYCRWRKGHHVPSKFLIERMEKALQKL